MFWDRISALYDLLENVYNRKGYTETGQKVSDYMESGDDVLECACGTGGISVHLALKCGKLIATDFSDGMLRRAEKKCRRLDNVTFKKADITRLEFSDESFDKTVAGNVIYFLPEPKLAVEELLRVTKPGGKVIIPTYINQEKRSGLFAVRVMEILGAKFRRQFTFESYRNFFSDMGYSGAEFELVDGKMPCAIAVLNKDKNIHIIGRNFGK